MLKIKVKYKTIDFRTRVNSSKTYKKVFYMKDFDENNDDIKREINHILLCIHNLPPKILEFRKCRYTLLDKIKKHLVWYKV